MIGRRTPFRSGRRLASASASACKETVASRKKDGRGRQEVAKFHFSLRIIPICEQEEARKSLCEVSIPISTTSNVAGCAEVSIVSAGMCLAYLTIGPQGTKYLRNPLQVALWKGVCMIQRRFFFAGRIYVVRRDDNSRPLCGAGLRDSFPAPPLTLTWASTPVQGAAEPPE